MKRRPILTLAVIGYALMVAASIDLLEGFPLMLAGGVLIYIAGRLFASRYVKLLAGGLALMAVGCAAMVILSWKGGVGGATGRPMAWGVTALPYPAGILTLWVGGVLLVRDLRRAGRPAHRTTASALTPSSSPTEAPERHP